MGLWYANIHIAYKLRLYFWGNILPAWYFDMISCDCVAEWDFLPFPHPLSCSSLPKKHPGGTLWLVCRRELGVAGTGQGQLAVLSSVGSVTPLVFS